MSKQVKRYSELLALRNKLGNKKSTAMEYLDVLLQALDTVKEYEHLLDVSDVGLDGTSFPSGCWENMHEPDEDNKNLCVHCGVWLGDE